MRTQKLSWFFIVLTFLLFSGLTVFAADADDDFCSTTVHTLPFGPGMYKQYLEDASDVDWYKGGFSFSLITKVVMIPPYGKDYDIQIFDECGGAPVVTCSLSGDQSENCGAFIETTNDFYIKVYSSSGSSPVAPYWVAYASAGGTCNVTATDGNTALPSYACNAPLRAQNQRFSNFDSSPISYHYFEGLYTPSANFYNEAQGSQWYDLNGGFFTNWTTALYNPPAAGWPEPGNYTFKSSIIAYCTNGRLTTATAYAHPFVPVAPCPTCSDECSTSGTNQCLDANTSQTCGNYDADSCLEWGNNAFCIDGCDSQNGQCVVCENECSQSGANQCNANNSETCGNYDGDSCLEWGDSQFCVNGCNQSNGQCIQCSDECVTAGVQACYGHGYHVCGNFDSDTCLEWNQAQSCPNGCNQSTGQCNTCVSHDHLGCYGTPGVTDIYWFNSCNNVEQIYRNCKYTCANSANGPYCTTHFLNVVQNFVEPA